MVKYSKSSDQVRLPKRACFLLSTVVVVVFAVSRPGFAAGDNVEVTVSTNKASGIQTVSRTWTRGGRVVFREWRSGLMSRDAEGRDHLIVFVGPVLDVFEGTNVLYSWRSTCLGFTTKFSVATSQISVQVDDENRDGSPDLIVLLEGGNTCRDIIIKDADGVYSLTDGDLVARWNEQVRSGGFLPLSLRDWLLTLPGSDRDRASESVTDQIDTVGHSRIKPE